MKRIEEVFPTIIIPASLNKHTEDMIIEKLVFSKKNNKLKVIAVFQHIVEYEKIEELKNCIQDIWGENDISIELSVRFQLENELTAYEVITQYRNSILLELQRMDRIMWYLFNCAQVSGNENQIFLVYDSKMISDYKGKDLITFLQNMLLNRFGIVSEFQFEVKEKIRESDSERDYVQENSISRPIAVERVEIKRQPISQPIIQKKREWKKTPKNPDLIYGKNTEGTILSIEELDRLEGEVVIKGQIIAYEEKKIKRDDLLLIILLITDYTDTISVKLFVKVELLDDLRPYLKEDCFIKLKGVVSMDSFSKEKSISRSAGTG